MRSPVRCDAEHLRRSHRNQEQLAAPGREEDGDCEGSRRTCIWQPLGLLTTVKPPALRERHDYILSQIALHKNVRYTEDSNP